MENINIRLNGQNRNFTQLRKLIYSMNLLPAFSKSSLDPFTQKIFQQLEKGTDPSKLKLIIESELCVTYGLYQYEFNARELTQKIFDWWENSL
ncbi:hypothetical protein [Chryseobacterium arthrosphaerae]|uniref:hypothetical protein n=1 Tax=Chryseobacterium arthrosphaerae TaxID=651561 RepID=UPI001F4B9BF1|nr:hypothetical protein [Chryseobacterium arthrosphaerae]